MALVLLSLSNGWFPKDYHHSLTTKELLILSDTLVNEDNKLRKKFINELLEKEQKQADGFRIQLTDQKNPFRFYDKRLDSLKQLILKTKNYESFLADELKRIDPDRQDSKNLEEIRNTLLANDRLFQDTLSTHIASVAASESEERVFSTDLFHRVDWASASYDSTVSDLLAAHALPRSTSDRDDRIQEFEQELERKIEILEDWQPKRDLIVSAYEEQQSHYIGQLGVELELLDTINKEQRTFARKRLKELYTNVRAKGLLLFSFAWILSLVGYIIAMRNDEKQDSNGVGRDSYVLGLALMTILIIPLMQPIDENKIDLNRPFDAFTLSNWYLPNFLAGAFTDDRSPPATLPPRPTTVTYRVDTKALVDSLAKRDSSLEQRITSLETAISGLETNPKKITTIDSLIKILDTRSSNQPTRTDIQTAINDLIRRELNRDTPQNQ